MSTYRAWAFSRKVIGRLVSLACAGGLIGATMLSTAAARAPANPVDGASQQTTHETNPGPDRGTNQMIVRLHDNVAGRMSAPQQRSVILAAAERVSGPVEYRRDHGNGVHTLRLPRRMSEPELQEMVAQLEADPRVAHAEPDRIMRHTVVPNDAMYAAQWHYQAVAAVNYGANLPAAWDMEQGDPGIVVAVIDTGYRPHADLSGRFVPGYDFIDLDYDFVSSTSFPATANDGDGRDADARDPGDWVSAAENASGLFAGCGVSSSSWHGTHVAGTIGAVSNNGTGVSGVNWNSKILPVRVMGKCGGYSSDTIDGIRWAAGLSVPGAPANANPARVLNLSLGGNGACSSAYQNAIDEIVAAGAVVVVAAGNSRGPAAGSSPGNCAGVITVAATARNGSRASYSNHGPEVEIAAPGGDNRVDTRILSTWNSGTTIPMNDAYAEMQGTSMAAPHVAGIASLVLSVDPCLTPSAVNDLLRGTVTAFPSGSTCASGDCGTGIVNAGNAVSTARRMRAEREAAAAVAAAVSEQRTMPRARFAALSAVFIPVITRDWSTSEC